MLEALKVSDKKYLTSKFVNVKSSAEIHFMQTTSINFP